MKMSELRARVRCLIVGAFLCAWLPVGCGDSAEDPDDSETHFLAECTGSCTGGLECICGVCTKPCDASSACADLTSAAECADSCGEPGAPTKVCDLTCTTSADCSALGDGFACSAGHCRPYIVGASGGSGGTTSTGGSTSGGTSSSGGSGGTATSTCAASADPEPVSASPAEFDADTVARAAMIVGSCNPDDGVDRNAAHIWEGDLQTQYFYFRTGVQADCLANANCGCAAMDQCLGIAVDQPSSCTPGCTGDVFSYCGSDNSDLPAGYRYRIDCGKVGLSCDSANSCVDEAVVACDGTQAPTCTGDGAVEYCDGEMIRHSAPCASFGLVCQNGECVGTGAACTDTSFANDGEIIFQGESCSGGTLVACVNGQQANVDCATRGPGFTCQTAGDAFFCGLAAECVPADQGAGSPTNPASCEGTVLTFCNAGRLEHIDCTELGFSGCEIDHSVGHYGCIPALGL